MHILAIVPKRFIKDKNYNMSVVKWMRPHQNLYIKYQEFNGAVIIKLAQIELLEQKFRKRVWNAHKLMVLDKEERLNYLRLLKNLRLMARNTLSMVDLFGKDIEEHIRPRDR